MVNLPQDDVKPNQNSKQLLTYEHSAKMKIPGGISINELIGVEDERKRSQQFSSPYRSPVTGYEGYNTFASTFGDLLCKAIFTRHRGIRFQWVVVFSFVFHTKSYFFQVPLYPLWGNNRPNLVWLFVILNPPWHELSLRVSPVNPQLLSCLITAVLRRRTPCYERTSITCIRAQHNRGRCKFMSTKRWCRCTCGF